MQQNHATCIVCDKLFSLGVLIIFNIFSPAVNAFVSFLPNLELLTHIWNTLRHVYHWTLNLLYGVYDDFEKILIIMQPFEISMVDYKELDLLFWISEFLMVDTSPYVRKEVSS